MFIEATGDQRICRCGEATYPARLVFPARLGNNERTMQYCRTCNMAVYDMEEHGAASSRHQRNRGVNNARPL